MGPFENNARWVPGIGFSVFTFGEPIEPHVTAGLVCENDRRDSQHPALAFYGCEDLECTIATVNGVIHRITCDDVCCLYGYNLVGTERARIVALLAPELVVFEVPDYFATSDQAPTEWVVRCRELGFIGDMPAATNMICSLRIEGVGAGHLRREMLLNRTANRPPMLRPKLTVV